MILRVHCDARGLAHDPVVRQRLGPRGVDLKAGNVIGESRHCDDGSQKRRKKQPHDILPALTVNGFMVRRRALSRFGYSTWAMIHGPPPGSRTQANHPGNHIAERHGRAMAWDLEISDEAARQCMCALSGGEADMQRPPAVYRSGAND